MSMETVMTSFLRFRASDSAEQFGSKFLDTARNPEFIEGLTAEGGCPLGGVQSSGKTPFAFMAPAPI